jgi:hypothetical protein
MLINPPTGRPEKEGPARGRPSPMMNVNGWWCDRRRDVTTARDVRGCFRSQVIGIGPQFGVIFPMQTAIGPMQGYLNLKGYAEFDNHDRAAGWNAWITLSISPAAATPPPSVQPSLVHK